MAASTCPKCPNTSFELVEAKVNQSNYILYFVQCAKCGAVVGTHEHRNLAHALEIIAKGLKIGI